MYDHLMSITLADWMFIGAAVGGYALILIVREWW